MGVELDPRYQVEAYNEIQSSIKETGKAGVVLPTGTGKTYLALKLIEDNLDKDKILYVSPSPTINVQVRKKIKEIYPKEEAEKILSKVKFVTYSGLDKRFKNDEFDMREYKADVIILDEVHRSGAEDWGKAVDYLLETNSNAQVLGMTATPLRSDGQNMIEKRFGEVAYELKLSEAVARGILTLPTYISSRYIFEEEVQDLQEKINSIEDEKKKQEFQEKLDKAKKSVENAGGVKEILKKHMKDGKWLVFCNPGDDIEKLQEQAIKEGWFDSINKNQTFLRVESTRTDSENDMALRTFERKGGEDLRILYSKNMLNEGIHDEEITGEIMLRPTKSYILFTQQLGRILSKDRPEEPIVLDLVGNIKYFKEFRLEIQNIIREGIARGDTRYNEKTLEQFKILEEQEDFIQAFETIEASIEEYMNKTAIEETLEILELLKLEGIDVTKIQQTIKENGKRRSSYLYEIDDKNIEEIIEKFGLDRNYPIGYKLRYIINSYKGYAHGIITEEIKQRIEALDIIKEEEKGYIEELLEILESLKSEGIDITKIQRSVRENKKKRFTYLYEIKDAKIEEVIEKLGLDKNYPIGQRMNTMMRAYRGTARVTITEKEKKRVKKLGLIKEEKSATEETLNILEKLEKEGVDVTKIQKFIIENDKQRTSYLYEVKVENIEEIIKKLGLDRNFPIGKRISTAQQIYRGTAGGTITDEDIVRLRKLGLIEDKISAIAETISVLEKLKEKGVDITKIKQKKCTKGEKRSTYLYEIPDEKIEDIIKELGLDRMYPIGMKINEMLQTYRGKNKLTITKKDKKKIRKLGLIKNKKSAVKDILDILEKLHNEGIDISKIQRYVREEGKQRSTYLYEIDKENINQIIEKLELDREYPIGKRIKDIVQAYKGQNNCEITESDKRRIAALGLIKKNKSVTAETLEILESLKTEGIDITKIQRTVKENGKDRRTYLYEIDNENIEEILEKLRLNRDYPIGAKINMMLRTYKGTTNR